MNKFCQKNSIPGICIIRTDLYGSEIHCGSMHDQISVNPESKFRAGSLIKLFIGNLIAISINRKLFHIDDKLQGVLKNCPSNISNITIKSLLTHTSGLPKNLRGRNFTRDELFKKLSTFNLINPGKFKYSNLGFIILRYLLEDINNQEFSVLLKKEILMPLGMTSTGIEESPGILSGYRYKSARLRKVPVKYNYNGIYNQGSLITTGSDMGKYLQAYLDEKSLLHLPFISCRQELMSYKGRSLGMAWVSKNGYSWKDGIVAGFTSYILISDHDKTAICALCNRHPFNVKTLSRGFLKKNLQYIK